LQKHAQIQVDFKELLPHRAPMIWIDEMVVATSDMGIAQTVLKDGELYFDKGEFYPSAYIELIAQAYAYSMAINGQENNQKLMGCYLTTIDKMNVLSPRKPKTGERLIIKVETIRNLHPAYVLSGSVYDENNVELCRANIKGFAFFEHEELPFATGLQG
jgi:predicted hotdog family 3-hydroxylacyl-ACP dehydratase